MSIFRKTLIIFTIVILVMVALFSTANFLISLRSFARQELETVESNLNRVRDQINYEILNIGIINSDWGSWDDTYKFIEDGNQEYINATLNDETIDGLSLNLIAYLNSENEPVFIKAYDYRNGTDMAVPEDFYQHVETGDVLVNLNENSKVEGSLLLSSGIMLISSRPILTSEGEGPIKGTLIMGRYLDATQVEKISQFTKIPISVYDRSSQSLSTATKEELLNINNSASNLASSSASNSASNTHLLSIITEIVEGNKIDGYTVIEDIYGNPNIFLKITLPRDVYTQGKNIILLSTILGSLLIIFFNFLIFFLLNKTFLGRFKMLYKLATDIVSGENGESKNIILLKGNDEIAEIGRQIDKTYREKNRTQEYKMLFENSHDGILITDEEGKVLSSNIALAKMLNYSNTEEFITTNTSLTSIFNNDVAAKIAEGKNDLFETRIKRRDGNSIWTEISSGAINKGDNKIILQAIIRDITERKKIEKKIKYLSFHDFLTGLYNRAFFEEELSRLDNDRNFPLGIIIGDVNGLKLINDAYGHDRGDELLVRISKVLKESFRKGDIIARWGGDEFIVVLPVTSEEIMNRIVDRITRKLEEHSTEELPLSISFGVELKTDTNDDIRAVIKSAEDKMYRHKMIEQKSVHRAIIATLEKALEERDYETEAHVRRMQELAITLGKEVKVSKNVLDELKLLAALHDIGKIAIADNILLKPGKLSPEEWTMVKKHPEIGFRIANSSADLGLIAEGILYHHESWNGSGYPKGLKGEEIPLISRIIAIVDAYDAMTNDRPYRAALSKDEAIKELRKCAGTQFDPNLVETFITIITQQSLIENVMA